MLHLLYVLRKRKVSVKGNIDTKDNKDQHTFRLGTFARHAFLYNKIQMIVMTVLRADVL